MRKSAITLTLLATATLAATVRAEDTKRSPELQVLDRFVGTWDVQVTVKPAEGEKITFDRVSERAWSLGGTFVRLEDANNLRRTGEKEFQLLWTYDPEAKNYPAVFMDGPNRGELTGTWDEKTTTMLWKGKSPDGSTSEGKHRFIGRDRAEASGVFKDADGKVVMEISWPQTRHRETAKGSSRPFVKKGHVTNAALIYWQAFALLPELSEEETRLLAQVEKREKPIGDGKRLLGGAGTALSMAQHVTPKTPCRWELIEDGASTPMPHLFKARLLARLMALQARADVAAGQHDAAVDHLAAAFLVARNVDDGTLVQLLTGNAIDSLVLDAAHPLLEKLKEPAMKRFAKGLAQLPPRPTLADAIGHERRLYAEWLRPIMIGDAVKLHERLKALFSGNATFRFMVVGTKQQRTQRFEELLGEYDQMIKASKMPLPKATFEFKRIQAALVKSDNVLARELVPNVTGVNEKHVEITARFAKLLSAGSLPATVKADDTTKAPNMTVDEIVAKHLEAIGGIEAHEKLKTRQIEGTLTIGGHPLKMSITQKSPDKVFARFEVPDAGVVTEACDGKSAWKKEGGVLRRIAGPELAQKLWDARFHKTLELVTKNKLTYRKNETVKGKDCHVLRFTTDDKFIDVCIDAKTHLMNEYRIGAKDGKASEYMAIRLGDYREVDGVQIAFSIDVSIGPDHTFLSLKLDEVTHGVDVADALFEAPDEKDTPRKENAKADDDAAADPVQNAVRLPKDGSWVEFQHGGTRYGKKEADSTITLRVVGTTTEDEQTCRWLEFQSTEDGKKTGFVLKCLVREKDFVAAGSTIKVLRGWIQPGEGTVEKLADDHKHEVEDILLAWLGRPKTAKTVKSEKVVDHEKGQLTIATASQGKLNTREAEFTQTIWAHQEIPFGFAAWKLSARSGDKVVFQGDATLQDHGTGAKSALPDKN